MSLTVTELSDILRANPTIALAAVREAKIAGPRQGDPRSSSRAGIDGTRVAYTFDEGRGDVAGNPPRGRQAYANRGESRADFDRRVDDLWRAGGWILVDDIPSPTPDSP